MSDLFEGWKGFCPTMMKNKYMKSGSRIVYETL